MYVFVEQPPLLPEMNPCMLLMVYLLTMRMYRDFLAALAHMPRAAGNALGVDRVLMLLLDAAHIDDVTALPWR